MLSKPHANDYLFTGCGDVPTFNAHTNVNQMEENVWLYGFM